MESGLIRSTDSKEFRYKMLRYILDFLRTNGYDELADAVVEKLEIDESEPFEFKGSLFDMYCKAVALSKNTSQGDASTIPHTQPSMDSEVGKSPPDSALQGEAAVE